MTVEQTVKDLLISLDEYPHIVEDQPLGEAVALLRSHTCEPGGHLLYAELLVLNPHGELVGRLTVKGILAGLSPKLFGSAEMPKFEGREADYPNLTILWEDHFLKTCTGMASKPVKEFVTPIKSELKPTDSLLKALYVMIRGDERCLPVLDAGTVVGMVRLKEIFDAVGRVCGL